MKADKEGEIIIPTGVSPWPHELKMAKILSVGGHTVEFIRESERYEEPSADVFIDGAQWELKSPRGNIKSIRRNLKKGRYQSKNIVLASFRANEVPDVAFLRETKAQDNEIDGIEHITLICRDGSIIDIK